MISMRSWCALALAAAVLAACSVERTASSAPDIVSENADVAELVEDARIAVRDGNLAQAGRLYDEALALEADNAALWVDIARLRFRGGEHLSAIEASDYALKLAPDYAPALLIRAQLMRDAYGLAESLDWFQAAIAADPDNAEALADYAASLGDLGRNQDMLAVVNHLAEVDPESPQVHYLRAVLAARAKQPVIASNLLTRSGLSQKGVPAAMMLDAILQMQQGTYDTAVEVLEELALKQPANRRVEQLLARALWLSGRDRELVNRFAADAERADASPFMVMLVGRSFERLGQRARGVPLIERARRVERTGPLVLAASAAIPPQTAQLRTMAGVGDFAGAEAAARQMLAGAPASGDFYALAGDVALASGNAQQALDYYATAAKVRRNWPLTRKIITAFRANGDALAADALLARYAKGDPHNIAALLMLAQTSAAREDWLRVAVLLDRAIALGAGSDLTVLDLRAKAARALGEEEQAARFEQSRAQLSPVDFLRQ